MPSWPALGQAPHTPLMQSLRKPNSFCQDTHANCAGILIWMLNSGLKLSAGCYNDRANGGSLHTAVLLVSYEDQGQQTMTPVESHNQRKKQNFVQVNPVSVASA